MNREEKTAIIEELKDIFASQNVFYVTDCSTMKVADINKFRRICFEKGIQIRVYKNTLVRLALEQIEGKDFTDIYPTLNGPTALMFSESANLPAKVIKEFRGDKEKPYLKSAYIDSSIFVGDNLLDQIISLKSKEELLGEVIGLLQSPMQSVIGALQSGGTTIQGVLKTLEERA